MTHISRASAPPIPLSAWLPWTDRAGRFVAFKLLVFALVCAPGLWMLLQWQQDMLLAKPITDLLRQTGDWAVRLLIATLVVTPLRFVTKWNRVVSVRRMIGLAALFYTVAHLVFYAWDEKFIWLTILSEMILRLYLSVGTVATLMMIALGVTSNDWGVRKLGAAGWNRLHWWMYPLTALSLLHYFMETRLDATQPALWTGFLVLFWVFRALRKSAIGTGVLPLSLLAIGAGVATALIEAGYYAISTGANALAVLPANFDFSFQIRPAWWVLGGGVILVLIRAVHDYVWEPYFGKAAMQRPPQRVKSAKAG